MAFALLISALLVSELLVSCATTVDAINVGNSKAVHTKRRM
jgi:hypothetical protein